MAKETVHWPCAVRNECRRVDLHEETGDESRARGRRRDDFVGEEYGRGADCIYLGRLERP